MVIVDDYAISNNVGECSPSGDCFEPDCGGYDIECSPSGDCPECPEDDQ